VILNLKDLNAIPLLKLDQMDNYFLLANLKLTPTQINHNKDAMLLPFLEPTVYLYLYAHPLKD